jgi:hypothetical protein
MFRSVLLIFFLAGAFTLPSTVQAQVGAKAYAPENLRQLSYSERVRVVEKEYYEQSGGRDIPDDQLEFYLDSIESGWTFSRIQEDISTSLGGNNGGNWNSGGNWSPHNVICSSIKNRYVECRAPFNGRAVLTQQMSKTRCEEGRNWGQRQGMIWVNQGCRGRFSETTGGGGWDNDNNWGNTNRVVCESNGSQYRECRTNFRGPAQLYRKISSNSCDAGRDWGSRSGYVWVRNGCRAEFYDSYGGNGNDNGWGNNNYTITCTSDGSDFKTCAWDHRYGSPRLVRQISKKSCISGRTWGYDNRGLWVNDGCRAVFGTR